MPAAGALGHPAPPPPLAPDIASAPLPRASSRNIAGGTLAGWLVVALIVLVLAALVAGRNEIVAQFPATAAVYQRLGLPVRMQLALEFRQLNSEERQEDGRVKFVVSGEIHNVSGQDRQVPPIRVGLLDAARQEIEFGLFDPPQPILPPGGRVRFEAQLSDPPPEARSFTVSFAETP